MRDPETGWVNLGTYRAMVDDEKHIILHISHGKDGRIIRDKYFDQNQPCPVAVIIGGDPLLFIAGSTELPQGVNEYDWVGGIRSKSCDVIEGKVTGLPISADAEIALEGFIVKDDYKDEGPFGEWPGYYARGARPEPRMEVKAVYYRNDPILCGAPPMRPPSEATLFRTCLRSSLLKDQLEKAGIRNVVATWFPEAGGARLMICVSIKQSYQGHATQAGHVASQCGVGAFFGRYVVVVDEDIDVTNINEVLWAMCTRSDPETSIQIIRRAWSTSVDPRLHPDDREKGISLNTRAVIDATKPYEWKDRFPPESALSPERRKLAQEKWGHILS
jgi:4-hydroxy-3-polyprenylbenzoate decarboxylase